MNTKCGCGKEVRYQHKSENGEVIGSCNKRVVCASYEQQLENNMALNDKLRPLKDSMGDSFMTCDSDGNGNYKVSITKKTLAEAQKLHRDLIRITN